MNGVIWPMPWQRREMLHHLANILETKAPTNGANFGSGKFWMVSLSGFNGILRVSRMREEFLGSRA
jgi:hypothetical protein